MTGRVSRIAESPGAAGPLLAEPPHWSALAACIAAPLDLHYPAKGQPNDKAKAVCAVCPVAAPCLEFALADPAGMWGVWGGTSERERQRLRRQRGGAVRRVPVRCQSGAHLMTPENTGPGRAVQGVQARSRA